MTPGSMLAGTALGVFYSLMVTLIVIAGPGDMDRRYWRVWVGGYAAIKAAVCVQFFLGHQGAGAILSLVGLAWLCAGLLWNKHGGDLKKRWSKLRSQALTAVNALRFERQMKEMHS
jgi:hypothetical protein